MPRQLIRYQCRNFIPLTLLHIFLVSLLVSACMKNSLETPEPIKQIIARQTSCTCEPFIDQYTWRGEAVYVESCSGPTCFCGVVYYDKEGKSITMPQGYTFNDFRLEANFVRNVWRCE